MRRWNRLFLRFDREHAFLFLIIIALIPHLGCSLGGGSQRRRRQRSLWLCKGWGRQSSFAYLRKSRWVGRGLRLGNEFLLFVILVEESSDGFLGLKSSGLCFGHEIHVVIVFYIKQSASLASKSKRLLFLLLLRDRSFDLFFLLLIVKDAIKFARTARFQRLRIIILERSTSEESI